MGFLSMMDIDWSKIDWWVPAICFLVGLIGSLIPALPLLFKSK